MEVNLLLIGFLIQAVSAEIKLPFTEFRSKVTPVKPNSIDRSPFLDPYESLVISKLTSLTPKIDFTQSCIYSEDNVLKPLFNEYSSPLFLKSTTSGLSVPKIEKSILDSIKTSKYQNVPTCYSLPQRYFLKTDSTSIPPFVNGQLPVFHDDYLQSYSFYNLPIQERIPNLTDDYYSAQTKSTSSSQISDMILRNRLALERLSLQNSLPCVSTLPKVPLEPLKITPFDAYNPNLTPLLSAANNLPSYNPNISYSSLFDVPTVLDIPVSTMAYGNSQNIAYFNPYYSFTPEYSLPYPLYYNSRTLPTVLAPIDYSYQNIKPNSNNLDVSSINLIDFLLKEKDLNPFTKETPTPIYQGCNLDQYFADSNLNTASNYDLNSLVATLKSLQGTDKISCSKPITEKENSAVNSPISTLASIVKTLGNLNKLKSKSSKPEYNNAEKDILDFPIPNLDFVIPNSVNNFERNINIPENLVVPDLFPAMNGFVNSIDFNPYVPSFDKNSNQQDFVVECTNYDVIKFPKTFSSPCLQDYICSQIPVVDDYDQYIPEISNILVPPILTNCIPEIRPLPYQSIVTSALPAIDLPLPYQLVTPAIDIPYQLVSTTLPTSKITVPVIDLIPPESIIDYNPPSCPSFLPPPSLPPFCYDLAPFSYDFPPLVIEPIVAKPKSSKNKKNMEKLLDFLVLTELLNGDDRDLVGLDALLGLLSLNS